MKRAGKLSVLGLSATVALSFCVVRGQSGVADAAEDICPRLPGARVPPVTLLRADGTPFELAKELAKKRSILIFYRGGW